MKQKKIGIWVGLVLCLELLIATFLLYSVRLRPFDMVEVNELTYSCISEWENLKKGNTKRMPTSVYSYAVLDDTGRLLYSENPELASNLNDAIREKDTIVDLSIDGQEVGKLILYHQEEKEWKKVRDYLFVLLFVCTGTTMLVLLTYLWALNKSIFKPFEELKTFASRVAGGNLDLPLSMDKTNTFGAFTESFDLMREELKKARKKEQEANKSKKELIAKLSHDIKTPIASIKAVAEVMAVYAKTEKEKQQLTVIETKADQVDRLISNLFHATLEELQELTVIPEEQDSRIIRELLLLADYQKKGKIGYAPECLVWFDKLRLQQVFDNLFVNSYKYANTPIEVTFSMEKEELVIRFRDYGSGVEEEELPLIIQKFYRGKGALEKSGSGLGLYISNYLLEQMGGSLQCENLENGFCIIVKLKI